MLSRSVAPPMRHDSRDCAASDADLASTFACPVATKCLEIATAIGWNGENGWVQLATDSGFQDRRIRPLCPPSGSADGKRRRAKKVVLRFGREVCEPPPPWPRTSAACS